MAASFPAAASACWKTIGSMSTRPGRASLGKIKSINVNVGPLPKLCNLPPEEMAEKIDWDMWLGPAPWGPYNSKRCSGSYSINGASWRSFSDYSGGGMTDWGAHHFGGATFICDVRELQPEEVIYHDDKEGRYLAYRYPNGLILYHNRPNTENMQIEGTPGEKLPPKPVPSYKGDGNISADFIHCVKTREKPFRDIELAVNTAVVSPSGQHRLPAQAIAEVGCRQARVHWRCRGQSPGRPRSPRAVAVVTVSRPLRDADASRRTRFIHSRYHSTTRISHDAGRCF